MYPCNVEAIPSRLTLILSKGAGSEAPLSTVRTVTTVTLPVVESTAGDLYFQEPQSRSHQELTVLTKEPEFRETGADPGS